jgi:hypothetical protein
MLMPCLHDAREIRLHQASNTVQFHGGEAVVRGKDQRLQPEFAQPVFSLNVHVPRFVAVEAVEEEPVRTRDVLDGGHCLFASLPLSETAGLLAHSIKAEHLDRCRRAVGRSITS